MTGLVARRYASHKVIFSLACLVLLAVILLFTALTPANYTVIILLLGLGLSAMFSMILAFGNEQSEKPDSRLMNLLSTTGSVGTLVGMFASSLMKACLGGHHLPGGLRRHDGSRFVRNGEPADEKERAVAKLAGGLTRPYIKGIIVRFDNPGLPAPRLKPYKSLYLEGLS